MSLRFWFMDDITSILTGLASAGEAHGPEYQKALADVALSFGVAPPQNDKVCGGEWNPARPVIECEYQWRERPD